MEAKWRKTPGETLCIDLPDGLRPAASELNLTQIQLRIILSKSTALLLGTCNAIGYNGVGHTLQFLPGELDEEPTSSTIIHASPSLFRKPGVRMKAGLKATDSLVSFVNSQNAGAQGTLMHLNRHMVVFEVYNPYSVVQLSEVLGNLKIRRGQRNIYDGRAVVTNLVSTGLMSIVSASLVEPWSDIADLQPGPELRREITGFLDDWEVTASVVEPQYRLAVSKMRNFMLEFSRWLEHGETLAGIKEPSATGSLVRDFVKDIESTSLPLFHQLYDEFEKAADQVPRKSAGAHRTYAQRELHPIIMCSPFAFRSFDKPLGYAGDYKMVEMMLSDPHDGVNSFAKVLNTSILTADAPSAHRNRIDMLYEKLTEEASRAARDQRRMTVLNIGCGPAAEVQRFIEENELSEIVDFELVDFSEETLDYAKQKIKEKIDKSSRKTSVQFRLQSVNDLIKDSMDSESASEKAYDMVYCAGLFDYFGDATCSALVELFYKWTKPGGRVVVTNVTPNHNTIHLMGHLLEWSLKLRDMAMMKVLAVPNIAHEIECDDTGVNVFLSQRKVD